MTLPVWCVDIDDTICLPHNHPDTSIRYGRATPIDSVISFLAKNRSDYRIVLLTARRMLTHSGDTQKIWDDVGQVTIDWLTEHGVPWDELWFGKPYAELYLDDKACLPGEIER